MKIKKLKISSFGALKNLDLELSDKLNIIYGRNESGKSTISAFIEAMLYSFPARDMSRKKYFPWDGSSPEGAVTLDVDGKEFTIFSRFGSTPKADELTVIPPVAYHNFIPKDRETYRKSVYCTESGAADFGKTEEMDALLHNIVETGDENVNASGAIAHLEKLRRSLKSSRGNSGKLDETEAKIALLEEKLFKTMKNEEASAAATERIKEKEAVLSQLAQRRENYKKLSEKRSREVNMDEISKNILMQQEYIASFPSSDKKLPAPPLFFTTFSALCYIFAIFLFFMGLFVYKPLLYVFFIPILIQLAAYIFKKRKHSFLLHSFLSSAGCTSLEEYEKMCADKEEAIAHLSYLLTKKAENITSPFTEEYEKEINSISEKMLIIKDEIALLKEGVSHSDTSCEEIKKQLEYYKAERLDILKKISAIDMAISAIEYAKNNIATDFTPIVTQKAMKYISLVAPKEGRKISLSESLSLEVSDPVPRDFSSYSKGFLDVAYLCYRLALSEFLFPEPLPIILDNPFSSSDDYRQESLLKLLVSVSEKHQIIVFTNRKSTTFDQLNCNYIDISYKNGV